MSRRIIEGHFIFRRVHNDVPRVHRPITCTPEEVAGLLSGTLRELRRPVEWRTDLPWHVPIWDLAWPVSDQRMLWVPAHHRLDTPEEQSPWRVHPPYCDVRDRLWPRLRGRRSWVQCSGFDIKPRVERDAASPSGWTWVLGMVPVEPPP
jgi:hypothetical protein